MCPDAIGDLSRAFALRRSNSRTKGLIATLSRELSTGVKSDVPRSFGGDTRRLAGVEHRLRTLESLQRNCHEVAGRLDAGQSAMAGMQAIAARVGKTLLGTSMMTGVQSVNILLADARANLDSAVGLLNTQTAGEFMFAGSRVTTRPVADPDAILQEVASAIAGLTDLDQIVAGVDAFFDAPPGGGGFVDRLYLGASDGPGQVAVGPERGVGSDLTAVAQPFRDLLKGLVLASLVAEGVVGASESERRTAAQAAGSRVTGAEGGLINVQSAHGVLQEAVEQARSRNAAETSSLQIARTEMVGADPFETAAALTEAQVQLESLYAVTARLSQLGLARRL